MGTYNNYMALFDYYEKRLDIFLKYQDKICSGVHPDQLIVTALSDLIRDLENSILFITMMMNIISGPNPNMIIQFFSLDQDYNLNDETEKLAQAFNAYRNLWVEATGLNDRMWQLDDYD